MEYQYYKNQSFEFLAAGSVIYGQHGIPNFSVKLAYEIFNRAVHHLDTKKNLSLYDPCCGGAYMLTTIALLQQGLISKIYASDINPDFLSTATKNLSLLTRQGLQQREQEVKSLYQNYSKESHLKTLSLFDQFYKRVDNNTEAIHSTVFEQDILNPSKSQASFTADIIMTDVPYGNLVNWSGENGIDTLLHTVSANLHPKSVICIVHDRHQKRMDQNFSRLEKFKVGKRIVELLRPNMF